MAPRTNLTIFEVRNMRRLWADGYPICRIQRAFGVSQRTVSNVVHERTHTRVRPVDKASTPHPFDTMTLTEIHEACVKFGNRGHDRERAAMSGLSDQNQEVLVGMNGWNEIAVEPPGLREMR